MTVGFPEKNLNLYVVGLDFQIRLRLKRRIGKQKIKLIVLFFVFMISPLWFDLKKVFCIKLLIFWLIINLKLSSVFKKLNRQKNLTYLLKYPACVFCLWKFKQRKARVAVSSSLKQNELHFEMSGRLNFLFSFYQYIESIIPVIIC